MDVIPGPRSGGEVGDGPGLAARRRYLVRQAVIGALALVVVGGLFLVLADRWRPRGTSQGVPPAAVLGVAAIVASAALATRWLADLRSAPGRSLWSIADRERVSAVRARLVQRMALPPEDRDVAAAIVRAETSRAGRVATGVEALGVLAVPAVGFLLQLRETAAVLGMALVAAVTLAPRWWLWRRLVTRARTEGFLP